MKNKIFRLSQLDRTSASVLTKAASVCFGHFNAIHPGHIRYFRNAQKYGDAVIVALEGDSQLSGDERRRFFDEMDRALSVASLDLVDIVIILDRGSLETLASELSFQALVLGKEFEGVRAKKISRAIELSRGKNIKVVFDAGETHYAGADLLERSLGDSERKRWGEFIAAQQTQNISVDDAFAHLLHSDQCRLMVIGDTIVDRYVACDPIGMSNEAPVIVVKEMETRDYLGGAAIVAAHVAALGAECFFLSVVGLDNEANFVTNKLPELGVEPIVFEDSSRPTTFKIRYMVDTQKLFRVSRLNEHRLSVNLEKRIISEINARAPSLDGIVVSDFAYGTITPRIVAALNKAKEEHNLQLFGDLQCSSQVGNVTQFKDFSLICPTEREARIALGNQNDGVEYIANLLLERTSTPNIVLKLGGDGFIAYQGKEGVEGFVERQHFPALTANPVDVAGAGDALLATMAVGLSQGLGLMSVSALACCVSAVAVQTVGNSPIGVDTAQRFLDDMKRAMSGQTS